jgi:hypothetical protein
MREPLTGTLTNPLYRPKKNPHGLVPVLKPAISLQS